MKKILTLLTILFSSLFISHALAASDITYPIKELGGCKNKSECKTFCDKTENINGVCFIFAKQHNLISQEEIQLAEKFTKATAANGGPSFCKQNSGCDIVKYCEDTSHLNDCLGFAEQNGLMESKEIERAKKVATAIQKGVNMPGGCNSKLSCMDYCTDLSHSNECLKVGQELGILTPKEVEDTKKFVVLAQSGQTPGGSKSKDECLAYCKGNLEECLNFAQKAGFLSSKEIDMVKKTGGKGPGGCSSKGECEAYCNDSSHRNECLQYAKENNIQVSFNGPGGCSDEASCKEYCMKNQSDAECQKMMGQYGGFSGPGGCKDIASCTEYCKSNPKDSECAKYAGSAGYSGFSGPGGCTDPKDSACAQYAGQYGGSDQQDQREKF